MMWEFCKGNENLTKKIAQDLGIPRKTVGKYRKIFRDILMQQNLRHPIKMSGELVFDETMSSGFKTKKNGRAHGPATWTFVVSNKQAGDRKVRCYNTQIRNGQTLAPFFF